MPEIEAALEKIEQTCCCISAVPDQSPSETQAEPSIKPVEPVPVPQLPLYSAPSPHPQTLPYPDLPYAAGWNYYADTELNGVGRVNSFIDYNPIPENTGLEYPLPVLPVSSENLVTQRYLEPPPFDYTVPQGKSSTDSGYHTWEPNDTETAPTADTVATAPFPAVWEHDIWSGVEECTDTGPYPQDLEDALSQASRGQGY